SSIAPALGDARFTSAIMAGREPMRSASANRRAGGRASAARRRPATSSGRSSRSRRIVPTRSVRKPIERGSLSGLGSGLGPCEGVAHHDPTLERSATHHRSDRSDVAEHAQIVDRPYPAGRERRPARPYDTPAGLDARSLERADSGDRGDEEPRGTRSLQPPDRAHEIEPLPSDGPRVAGTDAPPVDLEADDDGSSPAGERRDRPGLVVQRARG